MSHRYLFGPVPAADAEQKLHEQRRAGTCLTFNARGDTDLRTGPGDAPLLPDAPRPCQAAESPL